MERRGKEKPLVNNLGSFHRDTLPWTPAVCPHMALFVDDSTKVHL